MYINTKQALEVAKKKGVIISRVTLIRWCKEAELGYQSLIFWADDTCTNGRWYIDKEKFIQYLKERFIQYLKEK